MFRMKKVFAFILTLIMVCSLAATSVRADEEDISETGVESVIEENNIAETADEEVEEEFEPEVEGESSTVESDEKPAVSEAVQGVTVESITVEENSVDETPSEEKSFDEITETPKKSGSNRSSETYVLTEGEELHIPYIQGTETVRASFVPEESGYYNFNYSTGDDVMIDRLSLINEEGVYYANYDADNLAYFYGYTALQDVYLTSGHMYYYEVEYTGAVSGNETNYMTFSVFVSTNNRNCGKNGAAVYWGLTEDGVLSISGSGAMKSFDSYYSAANTPWFCRNIRHVIIESGVTKIGDCAFYGCTSLTSVIIPDSVTSIGKNVFDGCTRLESVIIPDSVTSIGSWAFCGCTSLKSMIIPSSITILDGTFSGCTSLFSVTIPDSVTTIGYMAFGNCKSLANIDIPSSVTMIDNSAFYGCISLLSVVVPESVDTIGYDAFRNCESLTSVDISDSVLLIDEGAFAGCTSLISIDIPDSVTTIGGGAFNGCTSLENVTIGDGVTTIGNMAFYNCTSLSNVIIGANVTTIEQNIFRFCSSLTSIDIPDRVTLIDGWAFNGCTSLISVTIPNSVTSIESGAFSSCSNLESVYYCGTKEEWNEITGDGKAEIASKLICIKDSGNYGEQDINNWILLQDGTLYLFGTGTIPTYSRSNPAPWHEYASVIKKVVIGNEISSIGNKCFDGCGSNVSYYYLGTSAPECLDTQANAAGLTAASDFGMAREITWILVGDTLTVSGEGVCPRINSTHKSDVVHAVIEFGITEIGDSLFSGFSSMTDISLSDSLTTIGNDAFFDCSLLTDVTIPNSVTTIGAYAFSGCSSLTGMTIPDSVTTIGVYAFSGCRSLMSVTIPNSVTSLGGGAFRCCNSLVSVTIPDNINDIREMFYECTSLTSVTIPDNVTSIGKFAFYGCSSLTSVTIPESVTMIGGNAFIGCSQLSDVYYNGTQARWNGISIDYGNDVLLSETTTIHYGKTGESGTCGDSLNWELVEDVLTIYGTGQMWDFVSGTEAPWYSVQVPVSTVIIDDGAASIGNNAFSGYTALTSVTLPDSLTSIGINAFKGCIGLQSIEIRTGVTEIKNNAFSGCTGLTEVILPDTLTVLGNNAFQGCIGLNSISLPAGLETIGDYAFQSCRNITEIVLPDGLTSIGNSAFAGCSGLSAVTVPGTVALVPDMAFELCTGLESITLGEGVTGLGEEVFADCSGIAEVHLPVSLTAVGAYSFDGCNSLTDVYYAGSQTDWQNMVIAEGNDPLLQAEIHYAIDDTVYDAAYAESFIDAIPSLDQLTLEDKSVVEAAREAYDRIPSDEQANVDAEKLAKLTAAEERIAQLEAEASRFYVVTVTSSGDGISSSIAPVYGGGYYHAGETVTVGASIVSGFTFIGWTVNGITVSTEPEYTFTVEGDTDLVAAYQIKNEVTYSLKITGVDFKINGIPQNNSYHESFASGTEVELSYYGSDTFLRWENTSNQPQSIEPTVTLTMNRNYELKVITVRGIPGDDTNGYYAYVEFISPYDQVMSASTWSSKDSYLSHALPGSVSKSGYSFAGWTMDGENAAGTKDIIASIDASHSYIGLTALMEVLDTPRTVTVFDANGNTTEKQVNLGKTVTLKAGTVSGKTFKCWALDAQGNIPLSYSAAYSFKVTTDISVYAIYVNAGESVTALPVAASTGVYAFTDGGKNKLSFTGNYDVPDGYTVVEYGLLYGTKASEFTDVETADQKLVYGSENTYVKQQASTFRLKRDSYEYLINVTGYLNNYVYAKAYLVVINNSTGEQEVYYGRLMYGTYNNLSSSGS